MVLYVFFFFQAEDGIRDLVRSRGLGDVYKRQGCVCAGTFQDTDSDGICDANDNCPNLAGQQGDACTDGDPCTINDVILSLIHI